MDISTMLEVQVDEVKETDSKENVTPKDLKPTMPTVLQPISPEECNYYKLAFGNDISSVRFRRIHCTACDVHIGSAPSQAHNMFEHPILRTLLCAKCREFYGDGTFEQGDDATDMFCRWCANGGNLYCCSYCSNTFCYKCIRRNFDSLVRKKIEADEKWKCFVCNPGDLYSTRAMCWALLQHIQTVTRLLQSDRVMSPEEVEKRMNLDESDCCPRRRKRKRRRTGSNSEDEDETYEPNLNDESMTAKRRPLKRRYKHRRKSISNGSFPLIPIKPAPVSPESTSNTSEGSSSLSSVDRTKTGNVSTNSGSAFVLPVSKQQQDTLLPSRVNPTVLETAKPPVVQTTLYNSTINAVPTVKLLQTTAAFKSIHSMLNPRIQAKNMYRPAYYSATQMVTIPNQKHPLALNKTRVILPKPRKTAQMMATPNIIELDSDSDEPTVVPGVNFKHPHNMVKTENTKMNTNSSSTIAVPVALVSTDAACNNQIRRNEIENQSSRKIFSNSSKDENNFSQIVLAPHKGEIETILQNIKTKFNQILKISQAEELIKINVPNTRFKIRNLYHEICNTVTQLACLNDRIMRKYSSWEKLHSVKLKTAGDDTNMVLTLEENNQISLDMTCTNDSATDSESEDNLLTLTSSELLISNNVFEAFSKKKGMISRAVGDSSISCRDKSIQVYSVESRDYEQVIGYSKLMKSDHDSLAETSIVEHVTVSNNYLGKYQEQFIFYLQHIEDHGIEIDDTSNSNVLESLTNMEVDSNDTETISKKSSSTIFDKCSKSQNDLTENCTPGNENNVEDIEMSPAVSESETVSSITRIAETSTGSDTVNNEVEKKNAAVVSSTLLDQQYSNIQKKSLVGENSLISNEGNSTKNFGNVAPEDDCTIIEN